MKLEVEQVANAVIVNVHSENLDISNANLFKEQMLPIMDAHSVVVLNLTTLDFVDSSGLGALLSCLRTINSRSGQLKLYGMTRPVYSLFELVRMHRIFSVYPTLEEALASL